VLGAALGIRREAFEAVGGFDESFFMYFEEVDLCYRLGRAGWEVHFAPVTEVIHLGGASTNQIRMQMNREYFTSLKHFYRRHYSRFRLAVLSVLVNCLAWIRDPVFEKID
jgi:GT2 family glycosyltransferase